MFRLRCIIVSAVIYAYLAYSYAFKGKKGKFEVILQNVQSCPDPRPPYSKHITFFSKYSLIVVKGKRYFSGNTTITAPTPFKNFSGRTYAIDSSGKRVLKFQISQVSCKNILARSILMFYNVPVSMNNCMMSKGFYQYENMDIDKITHAMPGWHAPGDVVHELQLVKNGTTEFCHEISVRISEVN